MIASFRDGGSEDVYDGASTARARRTCPERIWQVAKRKLDMIHQAVHINDLRSPPGNRLEALKGAREGQYSIRINEQYRICFRWSERGAEDVEITDYH
jgi:toxin HigB-1